MSNWYATKKKANAELGMSLGRWLVLLHQGQHNEVGVKNDITNAVTQNPTAIDPMIARQTALTFFQGQMGQQATPDAMSTLDQWLSMVEGQSIAPQNPQQTETTGVVDDFLVQ